MKINYFSRTLVLWNPEKGVEATGPAAGDFAHQPASSPHLRLLPGCPPPSAISFPQFCAAGQIAVPRLLCWAGPCGGGVLMYEILLPLEEVVLGIWVNEHLGADELIRAGLIASKTTRNF
jgi:hypothetical protein